MPKTYRVYETLNLIHYVEAESEAQAIERVKDYGPLSPPPEFDTEIAVAEVITAEEYREEV